MLTGSTLVAVALCALGYVLYQRTSEYLPHHRLIALDGREREMSNIAERVQIDWATSESALESIRDDLGRAGLFTKQERTQARWYRIGALVIMTTCGFLVGIRLENLLALVFCSLIGLYVGYVLWRAYLRAVTKDFQRVVLFQLPLTLEAIILLAEAGLGILPAIENVVSEYDDTGKVNPVMRLLRLVYELSSHGMPFSQALELVATAADLKILRHVLLHLDISASEGGELVPALRNLSDHALAEWKVSVTTRVRRLENLVVFPVFASVIGLMLLIAAVPIIPVLKFRESMKSGRLVSTPVAETPVTPSEPLAIGK